MGTTNSDEKVTWDNGLSWIDNVLQNIDDYLILNRARGGDDARFEAMQELQQVARLAKKSHKYQSVKQKVAELKDKRIHKWGFWGSWGKESFSYKILEAAIQHVFSEQDIRLQQTNPVDVAAQEKAMQLTKNDLRLQLAKTDTQKIAALEAIVRDQQELAAKLEGHLREISAENDAYKKAQAGFDHTKRLLNLDLNETRSAVQTERASAKQLQDNLVALRKEYEEYNAKMKTTIKLAADAEVLKAQNAQLQSAIEEDKRAADLQQQKFAALQKELEKANVALETAAAEIARLKERDKLINAEVTALTTVQQSVIEKEKKAKRSELNLSDDLSSLKEQVRMLKEQLEGKMAEIRQLHERREATCRLLSDKSDELKKQIQDKEDMNQHYAKIITQKGEENFKLRQFINTLFAIFKEIVSLLTGENKTKFDAQINALEEQKKQLMMPVAPTSSAPKASSPKLARKNSRVIEIGAPTPAKIAANVAQQSGSPLHHAAEPTSSSPASSPTTKNDPKAGTPTAVVQYKPN